MRWALGLVVASACWGQAMVYEATLDGQPIVYENVGGLAMYQGDIILGPAVKPNGARAASFTTGTLWPNGVVPYEIDAGLLATSQIAVQGAIDAWNGYGTPIHFQPRAGETAYVRFFRNNPAQGVCTSSVGRTGGEQLIRLDDACNTASVIHEIGHAIGMWHEQSRQDRNLHTTVLWENIQKSRASNFNLLPTSTARDVNAYEYASSMHYGAFAFNVGGRSVLESVPAGIPMGEASEMDPEDLDAVRKLYGGTSPQITVNSNPPGLSVLVDGQEITTPQSFDWTVGSTHRLGVPDLPQDRPLGRRYEFGKWSDGGAKEHQITVTAGVAVYTVNFVRRTQLLLQAGTGGTVAASPASADGFYTALTDIQVTATPGFGYRFFRWGTAPNASCANLALSANPLKLPQRTISSGCVAVFTQSVITTIDSDPPGQNVTVDGATYEAPVNFTFTAGSTHTVSARATVTSGPVRTQFVEWSDGGAIDHTITAQAGGGVITARFKRQYLLTLTQPSSNVGTLVATPSSADGFYDAGTTVSIQANLQGNFKVSFWTGDLAGRANPNTVMMDRDRLVGVGPSTSPPPLVLTHALSFAQGPIAPGEIVSIFGTGLGPAGGAGAKLGSDGRVTTEAGGTRVLFDGVPGPVVYAADGQVNAVAPYALAGKTTTSVVVENQGVARAAFVQGIVAAAPGIVGNGSGRAVVVNEDGSFNGPDRPARRGSVIVFFATGEGVTTPDGVDGRVGVAPLAKPVQAVQVRIGGKPAEVQYAGNAPGFVAGAMQVNVKVPDDAPIGDVSLYLVVGTAISPPPSLIRVE